MYLEVKQLEERYYLYKYRKKYYITYPESMVQVISKGKIHWLVSGEELDNPKINSLDVSIHGELVTHKDCLDIIDDYTRKVGANH